MTPLILIFDLISFSAGTTALLICAIAYARTRKEALWRYMILEALVLLQICIDLVSTLLYGDRPGPAPLRIVAYVLIFALSAAENYSIIGFLTALSGQSFRGALSRFNAALSLAILLSLVPGCVLLPRERAFGILDLSLSLFVNPLMIGNIAITGAWGYRRARMAGAGTAATVLKGYLAFLTTAASLVAIDTLAFNVFGADVFAAFNSVYELFYFVWNALSLVFFLNAARSFIGGFAVPDALVPVADAPRHSRLRGATAKYEKSSISEAEASSIMARISAAMEKGKPYLRAEFDLDALARLCGTSRAHASQALNRCGKGGFYGLVNAYRLEAAKRLLSDPDCALNVLEVAMESGYGSKASFYEAFRKSEDISPIDYRKAALASGDAAGSGLGMKRSLTAFGEARAETDEPRPDQITIESRRA